MEVPEHDSAAKAVGAIKYMRKMLQNAIEEELDVVTKCNEGRASRT